MIKKLFTKRQGDDGRVSVDLLLDSDLAQKLNNMKNKDDWVNDALRGMIGLI